MNTLETAQLLAAASLVDNRHVTEETVVEWQRILGHIHIGLAREAMELHFRESTDYLRPAHIVINARRLATPKSNDSTPADTHALTGSQRRTAPRPVSEQAMAEGIQEGHWPEYMTAVQEYNQQLRSTGLPVVTELAARDIFDEQVALMNASRRRGGRPMVEVIES